MKHMDDSRVLDCYQTYKDTIYKLAYSYCKDKSQAEDAFQEVFYKFMKRSPQFKTREHEKAWFIRTTINVCKDMLKSKWNNVVVQLEEWDSDHAFQECPGDLFDELRECILALPEKYRVPIHLYYYEEYSVREIAHILHRSESAVQTQLQRGREKIKQVMERSDNYETESRYLQGSHGEYSDFGRSGTNTIRKCFTAK